MTYLTDAAQFVITSTNLHLNIGNHVNDEQNVIDQFNI